MAQRRAQHEKAIQAQIVGLLRAFGAGVYVLGTRRRRGDHPGTMQTPGLPDLIAFAPHPGGSDKWIALAVEVKAGKGRLSAAQQLFRKLCAASQLDYVTGGYDDVVAWLIERGVATSDNFPSYRISHERTITS